MQQAFALEVGYSSDRGQARETNEDSVIVTPPDYPPVPSRGLLVAVADGLGGHSSGEVASRTATEALHEVYYTNAFADLETSLRAAFRSANERVHEVAEQQRLPGMATTLTAAIIQGTRLIVGHVGDSRAYLIRGNQARQLTTDHSWVQEQVEEGALSAEEARDHPRRNVITRAIGQSPYLDVEIVTETLEPGDWVLLCSDGLTTQVKDDELPGIVATNRAQAAAEQLVAAANERGGPDNVTAALVHVGAPFAGAATPTPARPAAVRKRSGRASMPTWIFAACLAVALVLIAAGAYALGLIPLDRATSLAVGPTPIPAATVGAGATAAGLPVAPTLAAATVIAAAPPTTAPTVAPTATNTAEPTASPTAAPTATFAEGAMDARFTAFSPPKRYLTDPAGVCARPKPETGGVPCPEERKVYGDTEITVTGQGTGEAVPADDPNASNVWYYGQVALDDGRNVSGYFHSSGLEEMAPLVTTASESGTPGETPAAGATPAAAPTP